MNYWTNVTNLWNGKKSKQSWAEQADLTSGLLVLGGVGIGLGLMYMLDPDRGKRRRALARDQFVHATHVLNNAAGKTSRDLNNRAHGLWAEGSHLFKPDEVSDEVLTSRVRSQLGRIVSHPHAIQVTAQEGHVRLDGHVLANEADDLVLCVAKVRGVREIENQLTVHNDPDGISSLQGGRKRSGQRFELWQENWSPTTRLLAGLTGGALTGYCLKRRDAVGAMLGTVGFGLLVRAATNLDLQSLLGVGRDCRAIEVQKTININAPVEQVYAFWSDYKNFPRFMSNVRNVKANGDGSTRWTIAGPLGLPVKWTAEVTEQIPNELLAWQTVSGSVIGSSGTIHFEPTAKGSTQVQIQMCYHPPGGAVGHLLAKLFGADPKSEMDADLVRMKTLIETGHAPHDAAQPLPTGRAAALTRTNAA